MISVVFRGDLVFFWPEDGLLRSEIHAECDDSDTETREEASELGSSGEDG